MSINKDKISSVLQFYLNNMELEDKIMEALLDEEVE